MIWGSPILGNLHICEYLYLYSWDTYFGNLTSPLNVTKIYSRYSSESLSNNYTIDDSFAIHTLRWGKKHQRARERKFSEVCSHDSDVEGLGTWQGFDAT